MIFFKNYRNALDIKLINNICDQSDFINSIFGEEKEQIALYPSNNK